MAITDGYKAVLITGTSSGIGRATSLQLDRLGFHVFATVRKPADGEALCAEASPRLTPLLLDVTDEAAIAQAEKQVRQAVGEDGLYGLVNNAGYGFTSPVEFLPVEAYRELYEVLVVGPLLMIQAFLPLLRQAHGRIVNVGSVATLVVAPFHGPYTSSKLALRGLSDALRLELRPFQVDVSYIVCGSVNTPIWAGRTALEQQMSEGRSSEAETLYGPAYQRLQDYFQQLGDNGLPAEVPAQAIVKALTTRRPKSRYYVGADALLYRFAGRLLPGRLRDWVVMHTIGIE